MYTRHFYYISDVEVALQNSILSRAVHESVYWTKELLDCDQLISIKKGFFYAWFYGIGLGNLNILLNISNPSLDNAYALSLISNRNSTLPYLLVNGALNKKYKIKKTLYKLSKELSVYKDKEKVDSWVRATLYGKFLESWQQSLELWNDISFHDLIEKVIRVKFDNPSLIFTILEAVSRLEYIPLLYRHCVITAILCMNDATIEKAMTPLEEMGSTMNMYLEMWKSTYSHRKGRVYAIPSMYGRTVRGLLKNTDSNISELYDSDKLIEGQKFYNEIVKIYGSFHAFKEDTIAYEEFYSHYFHDDIPEEWPLEEQEKSHGRGLIEKDEKPNFEKFFNTLVSKDSECFIEDRDTIIKEYSDKYSLSLNFEEDLINKYSVLSMKSVQDSIENI
jgi:hypothetical protein